jgi:hypothetical protein
MKAVRLNKVVKIAKPSVLDANLQAGKKVRLRRIPEDIKKAKRFFTVGKDYTIQTPPENHLNTGMGVYVKADDKNVYLVGFPYFWRLPN